MWRMLSVASVASCFWCLNLDQKNPLKAAPLSVKVSKKSVIRVKMAITSLARGQMMKVGSVVFTFFWDTL